MRKTRCLLILGCVLGTLCSSGCGEQREEMPAWDPITYNYLDDIKPLLDKQCVSCHGSTGAKGSYDLSTWQGLLGPGSDTVRNAVAADKTSVLLTALEKGSDHKGKLTSAQTRMLTTWVVEDKLAYFDSATHNPWWLTPTDRAAKSFHGGELRANKYDLTSCKGCHGNDLSGGSSKKSCATCHTGGVTTCSTCHGTVASSGAPAPDLSSNLDIAKVTVGLHAVHLTGTKFARVTCQDCHKVPTKLTDKGHVDTTSPAEVVFSALASGKKRGVTLKPTWDRKAGTCTNIYCHALDKGSAATWTWTTKSTAGLTCDSCHGNPPSKTIKGATHGSGTACDSCHSGAYKNGVIDPSVHINGEVDF